MWENLQQKNLDGLIVASQPNISYLTGYLSRDSYLLLSNKGNIYFTDSRYLEEVKIKLKGIAVIQKINGSVFKLIAKAMRKLGLKRVGFEERLLAFGEYKNIKKSLAKSIDLIPTHSVIEDLRQVKDEGELKKIKKAAAITVKALEFIKDFVSPGKKEIEIAGELERFIRYNGADSSGFGIIVASGPNSSFPHHRTSQRKIKKNEPVLIDIGADYLGYKSDLTRVFFSGKIDSLTKEIYGIILKAQSQALRLIKPAAYANNIDFAARQYIAKKGYGKFFCHNLGHGIGLEIHEAPGISGKENIRLREGMVFTVEPAIYLPGKFGIRLEDMVLVTKDGCEVLSGALDK